MPGICRAPARDPPARARERELLRLDNLCKPPAERRTEPALYAAADAFHESPAFIDEATNIRTGTRYLQVLIDARGASIGRTRSWWRIWITAACAMASHSKMRAAAERLACDPDDIGALHAMTA